MRCHSVDCGTAGRRQLATQSAYAKHRSRSHDAVIRVYDDAGNVIETLVDALIISVESQNIENGAPGSSAGFGATSGLDMKRLFE